MISDLPSFSNETSDRISQLPEHIILRILFFLPAKDAVRSSILSKTWLSVWKSLLIFSFSSDAFSRKANLLKQDASLDAEDDGYMDLIDKSLEKLRRHKEIEIDAPNLQHYRYCVAKGKTAATPVFINSARLQVAELSKYLFPTDLPSQWFIHLMNCIPSFEYNVLRICVWHDMKNKNTVLESLKQISAAPVYLDVLSIIVCFRSFDFAAFFDCCFWICRPKMIIIKISCENTADLEDQLQRVKLIPREENPACCRNSQRKCWQHYLDDVKTLKAIKMKDDKYFRNCHENGIALTSSEVELIAIHLEWKMTGQKRNHRWESSQNLFQEHGFQFILR
ncbi:hypothetical protein V6N11_048796 [Hibiscus sabdariffa]|uniref:F-box domain-containing protein n=1 Tax=Hibiscus sabdariffa TaxID=183260 RepID=A0ABR2PWC2_9ROSI